MLNNNVVARSILEGGLGDHTISRSKNRSADLYAKIGTIVRPDFSGDRVSSVRIKVTGNPNLTGNRIPVEFGALLCVYSGIIKIRIA